MLIRSSVPGIGWPAIPDSKAAGLASVLLQLEHSQWWPTERLAFVQHQQLALLLEHAIATVPYYRAFPAAGDGSEAVLEAWSEFPVLTRADVQKAGEALHSDSPPARHGRVHTVRTSGSTGEPVAVLGNEMTRFFFQVFTIRDHLWQQRDLHAFFASIRPDRLDEPGGIESPHWDASIAALFETGPAALLHSSAPIEQQLRWLAEHRPGYLLSMPSNLRALADTCLASGVRLDSLQELLTFGEALTPATRARLEAVFEVPVVDMYSTLEVGYIALQCPEHQHYHVQAESALVEVLDARGRSCAPGQVGEIVVTPLHNFASPLLRYRLGDHVLVGAACPCGRGLPVIERIMGRERNLITLPDGSRHWPSFPEEEWMDIAPIRRMQLAQTGIDRVEVRLVMDRRLASTEQERLGQVLMKCLRHPFHFEFSYHETLQRGRNLKFEDFVSEL